VLPDTHMECETRWRAGRRPGSRRRNDQEFDPVEEEPVETVDSYAPEPAGRPVSIGVPRETAPGERRVALVPDIVKRLVAQGHEVIVESGAGDAAYLLDDAYSAAGATIVQGPSAVYERAELITKVQKPSPDEVALFRRGQALIAFLQPMVNTDLVRQLRDRGVTSFSMDAIPRTSRAQYMDALSSMATVAGYKAVLLAADRLPRFMPLLTTAAGNMPPSKFLVIGAGVAGLQAIATARRLGAVVEAYDTRPAVKEQVQSLGARFIEINTGATDTQTAAGYAREATPEELAAQQAELARRSARSDAIITTAAVPGRPAPRLIAAETVEQMAPGSVIVDLAAETGGNCELTQPGKVIEHNGVTIIGTTNLPSTLPIHASQMYAKNIQNLLGVLLTKDGALVLNMEDDIVAGTVITMDGQVLHEGTKARMG
jgi:NAD(P) transhydrogenase subunit alpha